MRFEIGKSYADVQVILGRLSGDHRSPKKYRIGAIVVSAIVAGVALWSAISIALRQRTDIGAVIIVILTLSVLGPAFAIAILEQAFARFRVSPAGIEKVLPIRGVVWKVSTDQIHRIDLEFLRAWQLVIATSDDRIYRVPLLGSLLAAFGTLYPEIGSDEPATLPAKLGYALYALLAIVAVGVAIMFWVLESRGLVSW